MSNPRCRVGDLAFVVSSSSAVENLGAIVECVKYLGVTRFPTGVVDHEWQVRAKGRPLKIASRDTGVFLCMGYDASAPDCCLSPIRPGKEPDEVVVRVGVPRTVQGVPV